MLNSEPGSSSFLVWVILFCGGLVWVIVHFWSQFNVAAHTTKIDIFNRYAPRFATREREFTRCRYGYVGIFVVFFVAVSASPHIFVEVLEEIGKAPALQDIVDRLTKMIGDPKVVAELGVFPVIIAWVLTGAHGLPGLKHVEYWIRSFFHSLGKIPESVQWTVSQLKSSTFNYRQCLGLSDAQAAPIGKILGIETLSEHDVMADDVLQAWCRINCLTARLVGMEPGETIFQDQFMSAYSGELDEIISQRDELRPIIAEYSAVVIAGKDSNAEMPDSSMRAHVRRRVRNLRERLFVFIACGLRSSLSTDAEINNGLKSLGFDVRSAPATHRSIWHLVVFVLAYFCIMTLVAAMLARLFHEWAETDKLKENVAAILLVPTEKSEGIRWLWTVTSGMFSFAAVATAFAIRRARLTRHEWFHLDERQRERPFAAYCATALVAACVGMITLLCVNISMNYGFGPSQHSFPTRLNQAIVATYPWAPMAFVVALTSLFVVDDDYVRMSARRRIALILARGLLVGVIGGFIANELSSVRYRGLEETSPAREALRSAIPYAASLIGMLIFLQTSYVTWILQRLERKAQLSGDMSKRWLNLRTGDGDEKEIRLKEDGEICLSDGNGGNENSAGNWVQYPECQVLYWNRPIPFGRNFLRDTGFLKRVSGTIMYTQSNGSAVGDLVAQGEFMEDSSLANPDDDNRPPALKVVGA